MIAFRDGNAKTAVLLEEVGAFWFVRAQQTVLYTLLFRPFPWSFPCVTRSVRINAIPLEHSIEMLKSTVNPRLPWLPLGRELINFE